MCRIFHQILDMMLSPSFYGRYIKLPPSDQTPSEICSNPKMFPFFKDCRGALDGTHIEMWVPEEAIPRYRNWEGYLSQNVLAACTFDLLFCYVLPGWEGSARDVLIFEDACHQSLAIAPGTYFLADAGFPICASVMIPYKGERYQLKEFANINQA